MIFSSLIFVFSFLPFLLIGNYLWQNRKWQNVLLFIGSLVFYAWGEKERVFIMLGSILANYIIGILIDKPGISSNAKKIRLAIGIIINLSVLAFFKYSSFIIENIQELFALFNLQIDISFKYQRLPIGISFYTFQSISYIIDVYRKETPAQRNFINLGLYIALFPQLIAGPIIRYIDISKQLNDRVHSLAKFNSGIKRFIIGLGKKLILANIIGYVVDEIYRLPVNEISTGMAWVAIVGYSLQIYFDFSGYSDMAIGLGKMFGFNIPENFNFPYISKSIREFWQRWHISLSNWFRDYLYIPLGGNRKGEGRTYFNLFMVFLLTGLWHGASWSFIAWGLLHGLFMIMERLWLGNVLVKLPSFIQNLYTLFVVVVAFVWFRVDSFGDALTIQKTMFGLNSNAKATFDLDMFTNSYFWTAFVIAVIASIPFKNLKFVKQFIEGPTNARRVVDSMFYGVVLFICIMTMVNGTYNPFIYFRF